MRDSLKLNKSKNVSNERDSLEDAKYMVNSMNNLNLNSLIDKNSKSTRLCSLKSRQSCNG